MAENDSDVVPYIPDLLNFKHEYLFRIIGRGEQRRRYGLELKCLFLILILYVPGLITTAFSGTLEMYIFDWRKIASTVMVGVIVWLLIRYIKNMKQRFENVGRIMSFPSREEGQEGYEEYRRFKEGIAIFNRWTRTKLESYWWLYLQVIGGAFCGFVIGMLTIDPELGWVSNSIFSELYLRVWYIFLGLLAGTCLNYIWTGFWVIRKYCEDVVSEERLLPLDPDRTGGLKELGRLSFDLDLIVAIPSLLFPIYLIQNPQIPIIKNVITPWILLSVLYAFTLILVFFVSISPAHDAMVKAKTNCLIELHKEYKQIHRGFLQKLESEELMTAEEYKRLSNLYELYDRVESMAVWPLDFQTTLRFSITSLLPLVTIGISISL
jgi:hypothetical protein